MTPSENYIEIGDAKYISLDSCITDWEKDPESIRVYKPDEIMEMWREAQNQGGE